MSTTFGLLESPGPRATQPSMATERPRDNEGNGVQVTVVGPWMTVTEFVDMIKQLQDSRRQ